MSVNYNYQQNHRQTSTNNTATTSASELFLLDRHREEWEESAIAPDQTEAVLISIPPWQEPENPWDEDDLPEAYDLIYPHGDDLPRRNDGRLTASALNQIHAKFLVDGGWTVKNLDLETGETSTFAPYKPDSPRWDDRKQKFIKYEHPRNQATGVFASPVTFGISLEVALRSDDEKFQKAWLQRFREELKAEMEAEDSQSLRELDTACFQGELGKISQLFRAIRHCKGSGFEQFKFVDSQNVTKLVKRVDSGFWEAVKAHPISVCITEGVKKANSLLTQGICAIGIPGVWNWIDKDAPRFVNEKGQEKRAKELTRQIKPLTKVKREFVLAFDEDTKTTTRYQVKIAQTVLGKALSREGGKVSILFWNPKAGKGIDDAIVANGSDWLNRTWQKRRSLSAWLYFDGKLRNVDKRLNQRWLSAEDIESNAKLVGIKSAKGTFKTGAIAEATAEARRSGTKILALSSLIRLTENLGERLGIDTQYNVRTSETRGALGMAITADSLHAGSQARFNPEDWEGCILVIDEVDQVLFHILTSIKTDIKNHREEVLTNLTLLCQVASKIYIADADLSHTSLSYINNLTGGCSQEVIVNDCKPAEGRTAYNYDRPEDLVAEAINAIGRGETVHIVTDSQQPKSLFGTINLETIIKSIYPDVEVLRGDKETVGNSEHAAYHFTEYLNENLPYYQVLITSPVINTGISIDIENHFDGVYALQVGAQSENSARQSMERVRANVDRHVWFSKIGNGRNLEGGGTESRSVLGSQKRQTKIHRDFLSKLESQHELDFECHASHTKAFAEYVARHNLGLSSFREIALEAMQDDGYAIAPGNRLSDEERKMWRDALKANKELNYEIRIREILNARSPDDQQYQELDSKRELTDSEQRTLRKGKLERAYGVEPDEELIEQDDNGIYPKLRLQFWLTQARDRVEERDTAEAKKHAEKTNYKPFQPDFNRNKYQAKVELFADAFDIFEILQMEGEITNYRLQDWWNKLQAKLTPHNVRTIKALTGLTVSPNETPIRTLGKFLDRIGYQLKFLGQRGKQGERYRAYTIEQQNSRTGEIFAYWLSQLEKRENVAAEIAA